MLTLKMKLILGLLGLALLTVTALSIGKGLRDRRQLLTALEVKDVEAGLREIRELQDASDQLASLRRQLESERQLSEANRMRAVEASKTAAERVRAYSATSDRLRASALAGGPAAPDCEPSQTVKELWK